MSEGSASAFPLVDQYTGTRLGVDLSAVRPGRVRVVESPRRLQREQSYGFIRALCWYWLADGRSVASVPPGAGEAVATVLRHSGAGPRHWGVRPAGAPSFMKAASPQVFDPEIAGCLTTAVNHALRAAGLEEVDRVLTDRFFACNASLLRRHGCGDCRRLVDGSVPPAEGLRLPTHCFPDGIAYGVVADGAVVSVAFAHRTGVMESKVAHLGVETAPAYRRRGCAKTAVSAVVAHVTRTGGEARYGCRPDNQASVATARSVGFVPYGVGLVLSSPVVGL